MTPTFEMDHVQSCVSIFAIDLAWLFALDSQCSVSVMAQLSITVGVVPPTYRLSPSYSAVLQGAAGLLAGESVVVTEAHTGL